MRRILLTQWFECGDATRGKELAECVQHNIDLGFDSVVIHNDSVDPMFFGPNVENIRTNTRITYKDFIDIVSNPKNFGSLVCLTNTDIKLDSHLFDLAGVMGENHLISITRYESSGQLAEYPWCTQDTWLLLSQPIHKSIIYQSAMPLGLPGCENRFAEIFFAAGYEVFNPCLSIKNVHVQAVQSVHRNENRIYGAYLFVPPCQLSDIGKVARPEAMPTPVYLPSFSKNLFKIGQ